MKAFNIFINVLCVMLAVLPIATLCLFLTLGLNADAMCIPAVAAIPEGFAGFVNDYKKDELNVSQLFYVLSNPKNDKTDNAASKQPNTKGDSISAAVDEAIMGSIIKKTMSPYTANTKVNKVCLSNSTGVSVDIAAELAKSLSYKVSKSKEPQILIYHTHTTESYMQSEEEYYTTADEPRTTDNKKNIVAIGEEVARQLESAGYSVIHDKTLHDYPGFSGSYFRSAETVKSILSKYPSIKIVIDIHRDSISSGKNDKVAPVVKIDGKEAAQVMLVMGSQTGTITDHPNWKENLRLALKLQYLFETSYPQFARAMLLRSTKYNQNLSTGAFLIEIGSEANTMEQALYSAELVGKTLCCFLDSQ